MDDIILAVNKLLKVCDPNEIEIEARIRKQLINEYTAKQLIKCIKHWDTTEYLEKKKISKNNRKCTYRQRLHIEVAQMNQKNHDTICKSSIAKADINDIWCTIHVSVETKLPYTLNYLNSVTPIRVKRYRTIINNYYVDVIYSEDDIRIEIEVCDVIIFINNAATQVCSLKENMLKVVKYVCTILQKPPLMVTKNIFVYFYDYKTVMHVTNTAFGPFCIDKKNFQKPYTMTAKIFFDIKKKLSNWVVTPKVDGIRRFLICFNKKMYSVGLMKDVVYEGTSDIDDITILDCEYANDSYYIFDVPVYKEEYCGNLSFDNRMNLMEEINYMLSHKSEINTCVKVYEKFDSFDKLCKLYENFMNEYIMDGMIFADITSDYMQKVAKWKLYSTIDLEIKEQNILLTCDGYRLDIECANIPENSYGVWEFAYENIHEHESKGILVAKRPRYDKPQANSKHIVFKNIYNSVPGTLFTGRGFYLMRKYHNMVKKQMITDANDHKAVILDIGTGQGGDINKWNRASKIFCIEPDATAVSEMYQRLDDTKNMKNKITVIPSRLADIDITQIDTKVNIFTAFFCMNQWQDDDWAMLKKLIKNKGSKKCRLLVIVMTNPKEHKSNNLEIKLMGPEKYNIKIHETRIMNIDEKAVSVAYLTKIANDCGLKLIKQNNLTHDFMTIDERRLSSMYTSLVYQI